MSDFIAGAITAPVVLGAYSSGGNVLLGVRNPNVGSVAVDNARWGVASGGNGIGSIETVSDSPLDGYSKSFRITGNTSGTRDWIQVVSRRLSSQETYRFTAYARSLSGTVTALLRFWSTRQEFIKTMSVGPSWTRLSFDASCPEWDEVSDIKWQMGITGAGGIEYIAPKLSPISGGITVSFAHSRGGEPLRDGDGAAGYRYRLFAADSILAESAMYRDDAEDDVGFSVSQWRVVPQSVVYDDIRMGAVDARGRVSPLSNSVFVSTVPEGTGVFARGCRSLSFDDCEFDGMDTVFKVEDSSISVSRSLMAPIPGGMYYDFDKDSVNVEFGNEYRRAR